MNYGRGQPPLGATGKFPDGKITKDDEGELALKIGIVEGKVVIDFGTEVVWFGMTVKQANDIASLIRKNAKRLLKMRMKRGN